MDMTPNSMTVLLEHGGITAVFALGLLWMLQKVGTRLIAAIDQQRQDHRVMMDKVIEKIDEHTAADAAVYGRLERLEGVLTGRESVTPIQGVPIQQEPPRSDVGLYGITKTPRAKTDPGKGGR